MTEDTTRAQPPDDPGSGAPASIGKYSIVRELGRGGMGRVYLGLRDSQQVAIKVIARDECRLADLEHFRIEQRALEVMRHDCIAKIFDTGVTETGQPYFVMEYVPGRPITQYCDHARLDLHERLALFRRVCEGVQHAHQKGVMHRDLKPSNILVMEQSGHPVPKIIDFGLARAAHGVDPAEVFYGSRIVGTPAYMSPEQAGGDDDIDTRTDVYSLGVLLYELLAGELPFPTQELLRAGQLEILRKIKEDEPPAPSEHLREDTAELRRTSTRFLRRTLRTDLDAVVMKALEKDRRQRYSTATELSSDVQRFLNGDPVAAGARSLGYRVSKWLAKYRLLVGSAAGVVLAIAGLTTWFVIETRAMEQRARRAEREARRNLAVADAHLFADLQRQPDREAWVATPDSVGRMDRWLAAVQGLIDRLPFHREQADRIGATGEPDDWRLQQLRGLIRGVESLRDDNRGVLAEVQRRREFARAIRQRSITEHASDWEAARRAIRADPRYPNLDLRPQLGLVPLRADPKSGLWEFAHLETGEPARVGADSRLQVDGETGLVFVLLPGRSSFLIGSQSEDPNAPNHDVNAGNDEELRTVSLRPFFLSKYEMTQGQWQRASRYNPSGTRVGQQYGGREITAANPVDNVSWDQCDAVLRKLGLLLPTEAQWEYGARAGTTTRWWCGATVQTLQGNANLADVTFERTWGPHVTRDLWPLVPGLDDGHARHAPVGTFPPNPFGIHETIGNLREWCRDAYGVGGRLRGGDGMRMDDGPNRSLRGGAWNHHERRSRVSCRTGKRPNLQSGEHGVRPVRALDDN